MIEPKSALLVRPHPREATELRLFMGDGSVIQVKISRDSLKGMAVDAPRLYITDSVA